MVLRILIMLFFVMVTTDTHGAVTRYEERTITYKEILASIMHLKNLAAQEKNRLSDTRTYSLTPSRYDPIIIEAVQTIDALSLAHQHMGEAIRKANSGGTTQEILTTFDVLLSTIETNRFYPADEKALFTKHLANALVYYNKKAPQTPREAILMLFDIHKSNVYNLGKRWNFNVREILKGF